MKWKSGHLIQSIMNSNHLNLKYDWYGDQFLDLNLKYGPLTQSIINSDQRITGIGSFASNFNFRYKHLKFEKLREKMNSKDNA